ncbi:MAG: hypothetical protein WBO10_01870 [Pyrinomonadaceae bacterium]
MKFMDLTQCGKRALSLSLLLVFVTASSMVTLATATQPIGELILSNKTNEVVTVNGEPASTGRTVFASSTITTPEGFGAVLNMGKGGKIELGPNTTFFIDGDGNVVTGNLTAGNVTVLNTAKGVGIKTLSGETLTLAAGETANANSTAPATRAKPGPGGLDWWYWGLIIGAGIAIPVIIIATKDDNNPTSPIR